MEPSRGSAAETMNVSQRGAASVVACSGSVAALAATAPKNEEAPPSPLAWTDAGTCTTAEIE